MSGLPNHNKDSFDREEARLKEMGAVPINPCSVAEPSTTVKGSEDYYKVLRRDLILMLTMADMIGLLPGWEQSYGASLEKTVAEQLKIPIIEDITKYEYNG
jgi:hypothetical protein